MESQETKIQEMQMLEQNLQNLLMQKQAFQIELSELDLALKEIETSGDEVYKVIGQLMIKSEKSKIKEDLENKKKILELRVKTFENQEISLKEQLEKIHKEITESVKK